MGNVAADDGPVRLTGNVLDLDPEAGLGVMTGEEVRVTDSSEPSKLRTLSTEKTTYAFREGVATYAGGGVVTTVEERIESTTGTFYRDDRRLHFSGDVHMEMDTLDVRSEQVIYLPRTGSGVSGGGDRDPSFGGVSGDRAGGRWSRAVAGLRAWRMPRPIPGWRPCMAADSLVMGDTLGLAVGRVVIRDTSGQYRLRADTAHFGPLSATGDSSTTMRLWVRPPLGSSMGRTLWMCGGGAGHRTRPGRSAVEALEGAALHLER